MNTKPVRLFIIFFTTILLPLGTLFLASKSLASPLKQSNPVIESTTLNTNNLSDGGQITLTVRAQSISPVDWINLRLDGPNGNIFGGGSGTTFTEISPGIWEKQRADTISKWAPSGVYTYSNLSVQNEAQLVSTTWPPITFTVNNSNLAQTPVIQSVILSTDTITDGGKISLTVRVQSNAPVNWINLRLDGPNGSIFGGGSGTTFTEMPSGIWENQRVDTISKWAPSGVYTYSNLSVENEGKLKSTIWPPFTFTANNSSSSQPPVIQSAMLNTETITDGGKLTLTVQAQSVSPVNWINLRLDGPNGNIFGGGSGTTFVEITSDIWKNQRVDTISEWAPSGVYTYSNLSVENEAQIKSAIWPPFNFAVKNGAQATISPTVGGVLTYTNKEGYSTEMNVPPGAVSQTTELKYIPIPSVVPPTGYNLVGRHKFMLTAYEDGTLKPDFVFLTPITIIVHYNEDDLVGLDETTMILSWKNGEVWEDVINTCSPSSSYERNTTQNWLKVSVCHLTEFAVFGETQLIYLPVMLRNR